MSGADGTRIGQNSEIPEENSILDSDHPPESSGSEELSAEPSVGDRKILIAEADEPDPIVIALASALERASAAGEWAVVAALAGELAARRAE